MGSLAFVSRVPASSALTWQMGNSCSISWKCEGKPKLSTPGRRGSPPGYIWITEPNPWEMRGSLHKMLRRRLLKKFKSLQANRKKGKIMRSLTHPPFSPWQLQGQGQSKSQTPEPCCQRECLTASTSEQACHAVNGCIKHKQTIVSSCSTKLHINQHNDSPNLPRFSAMVHHRQDATRGFENRHSVLISVEKKLKTVKKSFNRKQKLQAYLETGGFPQKSLTSSFSSWCICPGHILFYLWM